MKGLVCAICTETLSDDSSILTTRCGHLYHKECLQEWLIYRGDEDQGSCPNCRQLVKFSDCVSLYPMFATEDGNWNAELDGKTLGLTESQQRLKRHLEIDMELDPKLNCFNNLMHTAFTLFTVYFFIHLCCWYNDLKYLKFELEAYRLNDEDYISIKDDTVPFGYHWVLGLLTCFLTSVLFGFWSEYMKQKGVRSFGKYLWVCMAPLCLQF